MSGESTATTLQTTARSLAVIECIKRLDGATAGELVDELELSKSTVHNHLSTLQENQYVVREGNTYHLGLKFFYLGEYTTKRKPSYNAISATVRELAERTDMEVDFSVEEFGQVIVIFDKVGNTARKGFQLGHYFPIHACAAGKAILAALPTERVEAILDTHGLPKQTENTITERAELFECLERVRDRGYAINDEESNSGIQAVGTSVRGPMGSIVGGLSITDPAYRFPAHSDVGETLTEATERLEERIQTEWEKKHLPNEG